MLVAFCCACGAVLFGPSEIPSPAGSATSPAGISTEGETEWIYNPPALPKGRIGKNNCSPEFPFGFGGDPEFHPVDANDPITSSCWQKDETHDGWARQQLHAVHIESAPLCGGGPGDIVLNTDHPDAEGFEHVIRVCRPGGRGQLSPCGTSTGPGGCAVCTPVTVDCH
jgi:hypothetical protein